MDNRPMPVDEGRYARQTAFFGLGEIGQERLAKATVLVAGLGAVGGTLAQLLVRAGVGHLRLVDHDRVALDNLHRQLLYDEADAAGSVQKAEAGGRKLSAMNRQVKVEAVASEITPDNVTGFMADIDLALDGLDSFQARLIINQAAIDLQKPWIYTGVLGSGGNIKLILPGRTPCLRCLFPDIEPEDDLPGIDTVGILGPVPALAASVSASEAIKYLCGARDALIEGMLQFDLWRNTYEVTPLHHPRKNCSCLQPSG
jgi:adenylyltransferase/sulfurtransferase